MSTPTKPFVSDEQLLEIMRKDAQTGWKVERVRDLYQPELDRLTTEVERLRGTTNYEQVPRQALDDALLEVERLQKKADKWDALQKQIDKFYVNENGEELSDGDGGDLMDIGEAAAQAFGYL